MPMPITLISLIALITLIQHPTLHNITLSLLIHSTPSQVARVQFFNKNLPKRVSKFNICIIFAS